MIKLSDLMPTVDEHGNPMLKIYWLTATLHGGQKDRPAILVAISADGENFLPTSSEPKWYVPEKHILIPTSYEFFADTGLESESHIVLDQPQLGVKRKRKLAGWLRGPLVQEVIRRSPISITVIGKNPPNHKVEVLIRPWAFSAAVRPVTEQQKLALLVWIKMTRRGGAPLGCARYSGDSIAVHREGVPEFSQWVRAATEWLYDNLLAEDARAEWAGIVVRNPRAARRMLMTRDAHVAVANELSEEDVDRMVLAEMAVVAIAWMEESGEPKSMIRFIKKHVAPLFVVEAVE